MSLPSRLSRAARAALVLSVQTYVLSVFIQLTHLHRTHRLPLSTAVPYLVATQHHHLFSTAALNYVVLPFLLLPPFSALPQLLAAPLHAAQILNAVAFPLLQQPLTHLAPSEEVPLDPNLLRLAREAFVLEARANPTPLIFHVAIAIAFLFLSTYPRRQASCSAAVANGNKSVRRAHRRPAFTLLYLAVPAVCVLCYTAAAPHISSAPHHPDLVSLRTGQSLFYPLAHWAQSPNLSAPRAFVRAAFALLSAAVSARADPSKGAGALRSNAAKSRNMFLQSIHRHNAIDDHPGRLARDPAAAREKGGYNEFFRAVWRRPASPSTPTSDAGADGLAAAAEKLVRGAIDPVTRRHRSIVLVIMESTGAVSAMRETGDGLGMELDEKLTPALHRLFSTSSPAILFDRMYTSTPASAKSVGAILSGHAPTWGSAARKYLSRHVGPSALPVRLHAAGYRTGFFSASLDLDWDWTRWLLEDSLQFGTVSNCGRSIAASRRLNSWACEEEVAWEALLQFVREGKGANHENSVDSSTPFFAVIFTTAQHWPYSVSKRFKESGLNTRTDFNRSVVNARHLDYLRALSYTDNNFGRALDAMHGMNDGLADRTLFAVVGDHGETFGGRHKSNMLHRNNLYEENIRVFLLLAQPCFQTPGNATTVVDHRPASNIDIAQTLLGASSALNGNDRHSVSIADDVELQPGRNLLLRQDNATGGTVFFVKRSNPGAAGLIDGDWKFTMLMAKEKSERERLAKSTGSGGHEHGLADDGDALFDLSSDPKERVNLLVAGKNLSREYVRRSNTYAALVEIWYGMADCVYQEQFSSLTTHPFCRTVHLYRGREGQLGRVHSVELKEQNEWGGRGAAMVIIFSESSVLVRRGLTCVSVISRQACVSRTCPVPPLPVHLRYLSDGPTCLASESSRLSEVAPVVVAAESNHAVVPLSRSIMPQGGDGDAGVGLTAQIYDVRGGDIVLLSEEDVISRL